MKVSWPDISFNPVNQYILISAKDFYDLIDEYKISYSRLRDLDISKGQSIQPPEQSLPSWAKDRSG